jgi:hypothetical protein
MNASGGTSSTVAANNAAYLNSFLETTWRGAQRPLFFPAAGWMIDSPVVISHSSTKIEGASGEAHAASEDAYTVPHFSGPASRLVAYSDPPDPPCAADDHDSR